MDKQKEKIIENLRALTSIDVKGTLLKLGMNQGNLYAKRYSIEKMQLLYNTLVNDIIQELKNQGQL